MSPRALASVADLDPVRVVVHCRVSDNRKGTTSPDQQYENYQRVDAPSLGAVEVAHTVDLRPASKPNSPRPGWDETKRIIASGAVDLVWVWEATRLTRDLEDYAAFARLCIDSGVKVAVRTRVFDLTDADDYFQLLLAISLGIAEVMRLTKRVNRAKESSRDAGRPAGKVPFGYERIYDDRSGQLLRQQPDPALAPIVREVFRMTADGIPLGAVLAYLSEHAAAPSAKRAGEVREDGKVISGEWGRTSLRHLLQNRAYLGQCTYQDEVIKENAWTAIVDPGTFARVQQVLDDPTRRKNHSVELVHLLVGLVGCSVCGSRMRHRRARSRRYGAGYEQYVCKKNGCTSRKAEILESGLLVYIAERLSRADAIEAWRTSSVDVAGMRAEIDRAKLRIEKAEQALDEDEADVRDVKRLRARLEPRITELKAEIDKAEAGVPPLVADVCGPSMENVLAKIKRRPLLAQREIIATCLQNAELLRSETRGPRSSIGCRFMWAGVEEVTL